MAKPTVQNWDDVASTPMSPKIQRKFITGTQVMSVRLTLEQGGVVPHHHHHHEQITHLVSGKMEYVVDGEAHILNPGDVVMLPSNVPHSATALEDSVMLEVFSPPREDFLVD